MNLTKELKKDRIAIMGRPTWMYMGGVMCFGKWEVRTSVPTACTDGKNEYYGEAFMSKLSEAERRFVILHENMHKAARHLLIYKTLYKIDPQRANAACDYWINGELIKQDGGTGFIKMVDGGLYNPKYYGMTVVEIFKDLEGQGKGDGEDNPDDGEGMGNPCDSGEKDRQGNDITEGYPTGGNGSLDEHDWDGDELTEEEKESIERDIEIAIRQGRQLAGKMSGDKPRMIDGLLEGKVDWRKELAEFIKQVMAGRDESSWARLNRRLFPYGYFPSAVSTTIGRIAIAPDMSGSVTGPIISQFMGEIKKLCAEVHPAGVDILWWDTKVCSVQSFDASQLDGLENVLKPVGGGGTSPQCVADWLAEHQHNNYECVVLLSDGYVDSWPVFNIPSLWAMITDVVAEHGKTVRIDSQEAL